MGISAAAPLEKGGSRIKNVEKKNITKRGRNKKYDTTFFFIHNFNDCLTDDLLSDRLTD